MLGLQVCATALSLFSARCQTHGVIHARWSTLLSEPYANFLILFDSEVWSLFQWLLALSILPFLTLLESTVCLRVCVCVMWCGVPVLGRQKARIGDRLGTDLSLCCDSATPSPFLLLKTTINYLLPRQQEMISLIFFIFNYLYMFECRERCRCYQRPEEYVRFPEARVTAVCCPL